MMLGEACESFLARCAALNLARGTVAWYGRILRDLERFLAGHGIGELGAIQPANLRQYLSHLRQREQASETVFGTYGARES